MKKPQNCCEGTEQITPEPTANRPGLDAINYRVGRHGTFLETMKARLTQPELDGLQTREPNDPAIAMLDAWATVADVLTFYQERIANEGYLRTATERRSVLELARLAGYRPRPGVAASVYLAFAMENGSEGVIPAGTRAQSLPGPGEIPQAFETAENITARATWNELKLRSTRPQLMRKEVVEAKGVLYFKGTNTGLKVGSPLLIDYGGDQWLYLVADVAANRAADRTRILLTHWPQPALSVFVSWLKNLTREPENAVDHKAPAEAWLETIRVNANAQDLAWFSDWIRGSEFWVRDPDRKNKAITEDEWKTAIGEWEQFEEISALPLNFREWLKSQGGVWVARYPEQFQLSKDEVLLSWEQVYEYEGLKLIVKALTGIIIDLQTDHSRDGIEKHLPDWATVDEGTIEREYDICLNAARENLQNARDELSQPSTDPQHLQLFQRYSKGFESALDELDTLRKQLPTLLASGTHDEAAAWIASFYEANTAIYLFWNMLLRFMREFSYYEQPTGYDLYLKSYRFFYRVWQHFWQDYSDEFLDIIERAISNILPSLKEWLRIESGHLVSSLQRLQQHMEARDFGDQPAFVRWIHEGAVINQQATGILPTPVAAPIEPKARALHVKGEMLIAEKSAQSAPLETASQVLTLDWKSSALKRLQDTVSGLEKVSGLPPRSPILLVQSQEEILSGISDVGRKALSAYLPQSGEQVLNAMRGTPSLAFHVVRIYRFGVSAAVFGHNALRKDDFKIMPVSTSPEEPPSVSINDWTPNETENILWLDNAYEGIQAPSPMVILKRDDVPAITEVERVEEQSRSAYRVSGKSTRLQVRLLSGEPAWEPADFKDIRGTTVLIQAQSLELTEMPVMNALSAQTMELDIATDGLDVGRWVIVAGERGDVGSARGVQGTELAILARVEHLQDQGLPGDRTVTWLTFANKLAYTYRPGTVTVYGNVVKATHGETRTEVLGSGDGSQALQHFELSQKPLTYLAAVTPDGAVSTLETRVNDLLWHETGNLSEKGAADRAYTTQTDDDDKTTLSFGDGEHGARMPTGSENVRATYRTGIGKPGNVGAGRITLLSTRPLGVKGVTNPICASGGADRDTRDQMRKNVPLGMRSLGRIVSVEDYADFARTFAGIGKAQAARLIDGTQTLVYLTIAGVDDIPIDASSDLFRNLMNALRSYGDPNQAVQVAVRDLLALVIDARIRIAPDYEWQTLKPKIMARLLDQFSFERRELGQDVTRSDVVSTIQRVPGVVYVDLDRMDCLTKDLVENLITAEDPTPLIEKLTLRGRIVADVGHFDRDNVTGQFIIDKATGHRMLAPAQIAYLRPDLPETLVLNEV